MRWWGGLRRAEMLSEGTSLLATLDTSVPNLSKRNGTTLSSQVCLEDQVNLVCWQLLLFVKEKKKVIVETVFESFCFTSNKFTKSKEEGEREKERKKSFRDIGIWGIKEEVFIDEDFLEVKQQIKTWNCGCPPRGQVRCPHHNGGHFPLPTFNFSLLPYPVSEMMGKFWCDLNTSWFE